MYVIVVDVVEFDLINDNFFFNFLCFGYAPDYMILALSNPPNFKF